MRFVIRTFEVRRDAPADVPVVLPEREIEAGTIDSALKKTKELFAEERRPLRSLSFFAEGGLVAYVLPARVESKPEPTARNRRRKSRRPRR